MADRKASAPPEVVQPGVPTGLDHGRRALAEARHRGWLIRLENGRPMLTAPIASLSPALVDRLVELAAVLVVVLTEASR